MFGRDEDGRFLLLPDADGDVWQPDWPVVLIDWEAAHAFASWHAATTNRPWRLLGELEWEKSARGVDGRHYPWGDVLHPSWTCVRGSHPQRPLPAGVDSYPVDTSVYGIRGLGGNAQDWCADGFRLEGPPLEGARVPPPVAEGNGASRCLRGGYFSGTDRVARSAYRTRVDSWYRLEFLGFRLAYRPDSTGPGSA